MTQLVDMYSLPAVLFYSAVKGFEFAYFICFFIKKYKYPHHVTFLAFMAASVCSNAAVTLLFPGKTYISTLLCLTADIVILRLTTGDRLTRQLFEIGLTWLMFSTLNTTLASVIYWAVHVLFPDQIKIDTEGGRYEPLYMFIVAFSLFALVPLFLTPLLRRIGRKVPDFNNTYARFGTILLFPAMHVSGILLYADHVVSDTKYYSVSKGRSVCGFIIIITCLLVDIIVVICAVKLDRAETLREETRRDIAAKREYLASLPDSADSEGLRKLRHDMANILLTSQGLIAAGHEDKALRLLEAADSTFGETGSGPSEGPDDRT